MAAKDSIAPCMVGKRESVTKKLLCAHRTCISSYIKYSKNQPATVTNCRFTSSSVLPCGLSTPASHWRTGSRVELNLNLVPNSDARPGAVNSGGQKQRRVDHRAVQHHAPVQVRPGYAAGGAHSAQAFAGLQHVAQLHVNFAQVANHA